MRGLAVNSGCINSMATRLGEVKRLASDSSLITRSPGLAIT